jgi:hypothetical protein
MFKYVKEDNSVNEQFEKYNKIKSKREREKEKGKENKEDNDNDNDKDEEKEPEKRKKTIEISMNLIRLISGKANTFLDRNDIDQAVFEYYKNNDEFGKLFGLMFVMDQIGILANFSKYFADRMEEFKEKKYIFDINGTVQDYSTEESQNRLREYVNKSEMKYYDLIEGAYNYCINLKSIKIDDKRDNSRIIEENDNEESDDDNEQMKSKSSVDDTKKEKKNKIGLDEELSQEEEEISEKNGKNDKIIEEEKDDEGEDDDDNDDDAEEEESKNNKKKEKNKIDSKKRKADELKPKYKKSQTYKNKKK